MFPARDLILGLAPATLSDSSGANGYVDYKIVEAAVT